MADTDPDIDTAVLHSKRTEPSDLALRAVVFAKKELGNGEDGGNNIGPDLDRYRMGKLAAGPWCAALISYCFVQAADFLGVAVPFQIGAGAKRLYKAIGKAGSFHTIPIVGDVALWKRKGGYHVGLVIAKGSGAFSTVEGNKGASGKSKVRIFLHEIGEPHFVGFARCP